MSLEQDKSQDAENAGEESPQSTARDQGIVRLRKQIVHVDMQKNAQVDSKIISHQFYNTFNYQLLPRDQIAGRLTFGVISPRVGDGKTLVASNLGISFAVANDKRTLLVDLNIGRPKLHKIFGTRLEPGFISALQDPVIQVMDTPIKNLSVLPSGAAAMNVNPGLSQGGMSSDRLSSFGDLLLGVEHITAFRDLMYSLQEEFEVIIVDLPSLEAAEVPALYLNLLNGVIVVVNSGKTKKEEVDSLVHHLKENQVVGFVFNRVPS